MDSDALMLKAEIEAAFTDVPYPGDDNLVETKIPEDLAAAEFFKGIKWQDWKEKPGQLFRTLPTGYLFFLSPAAFHYYLPLYMILVLTDYDASDLLAGETVSSVALGGIDPKLRACTERRMSVMTPAQLKVILKYLEFFKQEHGMDFEPWPIDPAIESLRKAICNA